jgi:hypothetical protein
VVLVVLTQHHYLILVFVLFVFAFEILILLVITDLVLKTVQTRTVVAVVHALDQPAGILEGSF